MAVVPITGEGIAGLIAEARSAFAVNGWGQHKRLLDQRARLFVERLSWALLTETRLQHADTLRLINRVLAAQREQLGTLLRDSDRWEARIKDVKTAIETNVQIAFEAKKSLISAEAVAGAALSMLHPNSNRIHAKYRQGSTTTAFNLLVREFSLEYERNTGKRATVVTRDKGRHGPFLDFVEKYLGAFAREEGLEWPINRDQKANRAALAEKIHRVLYPRKGNKSFTGQAKAVVRGKIQLP